MMSPRIIVLIFIMFTATYTTTVYSSDLLCREESTSCDLSSMELSLSLINISKASIRQEYHNKQMPTGTEKKNLMKSISNLASLIESYNQCSQSYQSDHICGENGYAKLSKMYKYYESLPTRNNAEVVAKNTVAKNYKEMAATYRQCPQAQKCYLEVQMYKDKDEYIVTEYDRKNLLGNYGLGCQLKEPSEDFFFMNSIKSKKNVYRNMRGLLTFNSLLTCNVAGKNYKTNRKVNLTTMDKSGKKETYLTIVDDWEDVTNTGQGGIAKLPGKMQLKFKEKISIKHTAKAAVFKWGNSKNSPYIEVSMDTGEIVNSNIFDETFYSKSSCATTVKNNKLYPQLTRKK